MTAPVLWHLKVSHYNEKARWALDHKGVPHIRRAVVPGRHQAVAARVSGGSTLPVLVLDGTAIGDSTRIIEALERRHPHPPLYPADPDERARALALEDFFDEELGPQVRLLVLTCLLPDADLLLGTFAPDLSRVARLVARTTFPRLRPRIARQFGIDGSGVTRAFTAVQAAGARFRDEVGPSGYLVGDAFSVADLTLAALVAPVVAPPEFPYPQPQRDHPRLASLRLALTESGIFDWAREIYARHRDSSAEICQGSRPGSPPAATTASRAT